MLLNATFPIIAALSSLACNAHQIVLGKSQTESYHPFSADFDDFVQGLLKEWHVPGLAIAVVHENQTWAKGYGYASFPDEPVTPYTLFQGASTTKSFTASLAALIVQNETYEDIDWSTPLHDIVGNDFVLSDPYLTQHINLHDALSHRTGMPRHDAVWVNNEIGVKGEAHALRYLPTSAAFRTKWQYCNLMFTSVSHVLQTLTGRWHGDLLREWLWEPLGMNTSFYSYSDAFTCEKTEPNCKMAISYAWNNESQEYQEIDENSFHPANGAGGIISNVIDYSKWIRALMYEDGPVSKAGHAAIKTPLSVEAIEKYPYSGPLWYGMGLEGGIYRGERVFGHGGAIGGYFSHFTFLPDKKWGFVAFQNTAGQVVDIAGWKLIDEFLGTPTDEHAQMNKRYNEMQSEKTTETRALPTKLYPDVPSIPVRPRLPLPDYEGIYHHPSYGFMNITLTRPDSAVLQEPAIKGNAGLPLYSRSRHENILYTLHHVSGEYWLLEERSNVHNKRLPDDYTKARFEIGPNGDVEKLGVIMEKRVEGEAGWAWYNRVE